MTETLRLEVPDDAQRRLVALRPLLALLLDADLTIEACLDAVLARGLDAVTAELIQELDPEVLVASLQQPGSEDARPSISSGSRPPDPASATARYDREDGVDPPNE